MKPRKIASLRRIVIPKSFFCDLGLSKEGEVEITIEYGKICIKKFERKNIQEKKYIGVVRKLDELNRVVIPVEYMNVLGIKVNTNVSIILENDAIKISPV